MTIRRLPGALPPRLTPEQQATAEKYHYIAMRLADYYAAKRLPGVPDTDLLSAAHEALVIAVASSDLSNDALENYLWICVRGALKDLFRKTAKERGPTTPEPDAQTDRLLRRARAALDDYALTLEDPGDVFHDTHEDSVGHFAGASDGGATALAVGASGGAWYMRGEDGLAVRAEWVRTSKELHDAVSGLPPTLAAVTELRFFQEREINDIAERTGLSAPTVTRRIAKAIDLLRARLPPRGVTGLPADGGE
jgi:RNA polymerase sigma factor (sigma-70 family)